MLQLRPNCECCDKDLPPDSTDALICTFECTFCQACAEHCFANTCPNCSGGLVPRPVRPAQLLSKHPASSERVNKEHGCMRTESRPVPAMIGHVAMWARDLEGLKDFYTNYFGGRVGQKYVNPNKGFTSRFVDFSSGSRLELMHRDDVSIREMKPGEETTGLAHMAFSCGSKSSVDELTRRLRADGFQVLDGPRTTGDGYYESVVLDPEGNRVEITL